MCLLEQWPGVAVEVAGNVPSNLPPLREATVGLWEECRPKLHVAALALCPADVGAIGRGLGSSASKVEVQAGACC